MTTTKLKLPELTASQSQKHVTHNEALFFLDTLVQMSVIDRDLATPPGAPVLGDTYIVGPAPTGSWTGKTNQVASYDGSGWIFFVPLEGWKVWVSDEDRTITWDGAAWIGVLSSGDLQNLPGVGVNTSYDATNKLAVASEAVLFTNIGDNMQLKMNKDASGDTASLLFQTGFSGRAEMGTMGDDNFAVKVSPDGSAWTTAFSVNATTGLSVSVPVTGTAVTQSVTDPTTGRLLKVGDFGLGAPTPPVLSDLTAAINPGFYYISDLSAVTGGPSGAPALQGYAVIDRGTLGRVGVFLATSANASSSQRIWYGARTTTTGSLGWVEMFHRNNILGTVSQSAGVPTGAVIERGSNANGEYARFADGLQICTARVAGAAVTTAIGSIFRSGDVNWTYPAAFAAEPRVQASCAGATNLWANARPSATGNTTSAVARLFTFQSDATAWDMSLLAVGRWY